MALRVIYIKRGNFVTQKIIGAVPTENNFTDALKLKLEEMTGGTLTPEQLIAITNDVLESIDLTIYVEKITGKGLSTEDYTSEEKIKLSNIASGAEVNVQPDWNQDYSGADDYIKNKPATGSVPTAWGKYF